jgi:type III restriction enzyme
MSGFEVPEPILNSPFEEPKEHWHIVEGEVPEKRPGRRSAIYYYRDPRVPATGAGGPGPGTAIPMDLVNLIRERVGSWRAAGYPGASRTTLELLQWWRRDGREKRLFFAQIEAVETVLFMVEARADFRQGVEVPREEPGDEKRAAGYAAFLRYACKMATGSGKTTVMGMLSAWSILNKVASRSDGRFSDVVLVVCPNVTIRDRLRELDPLEGEASLYRTRDLVPRDSMAQLAQGRVLVTNWHVFEPHEVKAGGVSARVTKAGVPTVRPQKITIGPKTTTARGSRYLRLEDYEKQVAAGLLDVVAEERDKNGVLRKVTVRDTRHVESDAALLNRILGREVGGKQNILVLNDEAHHAYRIRREEPDEGEEDLFGEEEDIEEFVKEATVWIDGLDRIQKQRGINVCIDLSATPYFLARVGQETNRPFPWVVSDFGLIDSIESGLVKIPQMAVRDSSGAPIAGYFNVWKWILERLTPAERGAKRASPKPEAILKWANHPIAILGALWEEDLAAVSTADSDTRPPVFILVCKNTAIAKVVYEWLAEGISPTGVPASGLSGFRNENGATRTIRVDSKVVAETDTGEAKGDESRWMRFTLDTVGRLAWPADKQGRPLCPAGFEELAEKLKRPSHPPGRDVRAIVSVGMLTEGWDCTTVKYIVGLRPFQSQLLCEQVVGRGLRRTSYEIGENGLLSEEVAKVFGVPFEVIPFKASSGPPPPPMKRHHVRALPERCSYEIRFPRVEGYTQAIRDRVTVDWPTVPSLRVDPHDIPTEVEMKGLSLTVEGGFSLMGPGRSDEVTLRAFREGKRE